MKNKEFKIGELYRSDVNGAIFEVVDIQMGIDNKEYVHFKVQGKKETSHVQMRTAQELLITKFKGV